uniref:Integrase core domain containing protein n=1 Tax=Solanum tuberosum TaxID=4113 RepID=M1DFQ5_SOLTU
MPQLIQRDVLAAEKRIKDEMQKELAVLKDKMVGLEDHVQDQLQATFSVSTDKFKTQLDEMQAQVAKMAEKPVQVPTPAMPESMMKLFSEPPTTQSLEDFWRNSLKENPTRKNTMLESLMRSCMLAYPKKKEDNTRKPARHRGKRQEKTKHLKNNSEMRC